MTTKKTNGQVYIEDIALLLPVNKWIDRKAFSAKTGILEKSANPRLTKLVEGGYLEVSGKGSSLAEYRMTEDMQRLMLERGRLNRDQQGKRQRDKEKTIGAKKLNFDKVLFSTVWV